MHYRCVTDAETEQESARVAIVEVVESSRQLAGIVDPDADDAARNNEPAGLRDETFEVLGDSGVEAARGPQSSVPERFELRSDVAAAVLALPRTAPPDSELSQVH